MSDNIFICKICNKSFNNIYSFVSHIKNVHKPLTAKLYYDKFLKKETEGICPECGKPTKFKSITCGYKRFCSNNCSRHSPETREKYKQTCIARYGVDSTNKLSSMKDKAKQTNLEKYGTEYASQSEEFKARSRKTCLEKYGSEHSITSQNNIEKTKQTCLKRYGVNHYSKSADFKEKFKKTCQERYGVNAPAQCPEIYQKVKNTCLEKYGYENVSRNEVIKEQIRETNIEKYGVYNPMLNPEIQQKRIDTCIEKYGVPSYLEYSNFREQSIKTCLEKYGVEYIGQSHEIQKKRKQKYTYNGICFDSSWELAYYLFLTDHNIPFTFHPDIKFSYIANDKVHFYFPDFCISNELIEIKGDHFFDKSGNFKCPFNILDEKLQNEYKAKYQCMLDNNIKIMKYNEIRNILYYVKKIYGKNFLKQYKNNI